MGLAKKTLDRSDISTYPIKVKYSGSFASASATSYGITFNTGINTSYQANGAQYLNYKLAQQLYYNYYLTGSLATSASGWDPVWQSTAASGSLDDDYRYFPSASSSQIRLFAIPRTIFGENISRNSLNITAGSYNLIDDGNGNVRDANSSFVHVGNVFYSQGIIVITNSSYQGTFSGYTIRLKGETTIYQNEVRCKVSENDFNYSQNPSITKLGTTGSYIDAVTGSDYHPYATTVGLYNDADELLVVGKLSRAYPIPPNTDISFNIRWDS